jgi:3-hydroxyacyl-[acyl-carrier-protein] dehydratase
MTHPTPLVQALSSLPHGPEFRFIDTVTSIEPGRSATAQWTLKGDEAFLAGHFPGQPLLPGVVMIEALAQLGGILAQSDRPGRPLRDVRLTAVRQFKIFGSIAPGETLNIQAQCEATLPGLVQIKGEQTTRCLPLAASSSAAMSQPRGRPSFSKLIIKRVARSASSSFPESSHQQAA